MIQQQLGIERRGLRAWSVDRARYTEGDRPTILWKVALNDPRLSNPTSKQMSVTDMVVRAIISFALWMRIRRRY